MKGPSREIDWKPKFFPGQTVLLTLDGGIKEKGTVRKSYATTKGVRYSVEMMDGKVYQFPKSRMTLYKW